MLSGDFYYTKALDQHDGKINAILEINAKHTIFEGHFPGQPVVPGVCMMQMVKEILESVEGKRLLIDEAPNIKLLSVLNPNENNVVDSSISIDERVGDNQLKISATITNGSVVFFKMKATLRNL